MPENTYLETENKKPVALFGFRVPPYEIGVTMLKERGGSGNRGRQRSKRFENLGGTTSFLKTPFPKANEETNKTTARGGFRPPPYEIGATMRK